MSADDFQSKKRWDAHIKKLRQQLLKDADKPLTRDQRIVEDVLEIIGGAATIEDGIKRPIGRGDIEGSLYHMRQAIEAARRMRARQSKPAMRALRQLIAALRKAKGSLPEHVRPHGLEQALFHAEASTPEFLHSIRRAFPQAALPERKPKADAVEKRLAADAALDLCKRFGVRATTARGGKLCFVAAALYGDPDADMQYHCAKALAESRDKNRTRV